jgi:hypothetical protein
MIVTDLTVMSERDILLRIYNRAHRALEFDTMKAPPALVEKENELLGAACAEFLRRHPQ